jgi:hypothetical protein
MIKNNEKLWTIPSCLLTTTEISQPTYSNNKEDVLKNLKKKILGLFGFSKGEEMERVVSFMPRESKRRKKPDSIRISGSC